MLFCGYCVWCRVRSHCSHGLAAFTFSPRVKSADFTFERLSTLNCLCALRFEREGRSSRPCL